MTRGVHFIFAKSLGFFSPVAAGSKWEVLILHERNRVNLWGALASLWTMQSKGFYVSELDPEAPSRKDSVFHTDSVPTASSRAPAPKRNSQAPPGLPSLLSQS